MDRELSSYLDRNEHRGTARRSAACLLQTVALSAGCWAAMVGVSDGSCALRGTVASAWGLAVLRSYMIFHDCGHGSFFQGFGWAKTMNWATLQLASVLCATPTDWNVGHALHHANVGKLGQDDYDWGETVFHVRSEFVKKPVLEQRMWKLVRHPVPFFLAAPALTWFVKMRLPFELRPGRKAAYRRANKMLNLGFVLGRYAAAARMQILGMVLWGDYLAMLVGVLLFHWQHVYEPGYVRHRDEWTLHHAAMHGSSIVSVPEPLKWFTLGIEYHHIHHVRTRIPGYMLRSVHENAPGGTWKGVVALSYADMWRSIWLTVYDDVAQTYSTFDEITRRRRDPRVE